MLLEKTIKTFCNYSCSVQLHAAVGKGCDLLSISARVTMVGILTVVHVAGSLAGPAATVGTTLELGVVTVCVARADIGTDGGVAGRPSLRRTRPRTNDVDLVEKLTTFTARR